MVFKEQYPDQTFLSKIDVNHHKEAIVPFSANIILICESPLTPFPPATDFAALEGGGVKWCHELTGRGIGRWSHYQLDISKTGRHYGTLKIFIYQKIVSALGNLVKRFS